MLPGVMGRASLPELRGRVRLLRSSPRLARAGASHPAARGGAVHGGPPRWALPEVRERGPRCTGCARLINVPRKIHAPRTVSNVVPFVVTVVTGEAETELTAITTSTSTATATATATATSTATAAFSCCGRYRWWLERVWQPALPRLIFIGLNPSRADGRRDDPTLRRLLGFGRRWGYGALEVLNLFARVSPSPAVLRRAADPVRADTDDWIRRRLAAQPEATLWLGWGNQGGWRGRNRDVLALLQAHPTFQEQGRLGALGLTASGHPRHPLYVAGDVALRPLAWHNPEALGHPVGTHAPPSDATPCPAPPAATPFICT